MKDTTIGQIIKIFTDGACSGNPGKGGWGAIIAFPEGNVEELGGAEEETTSNRMELTAAIWALEKVAEKKYSSPQVELYTDSKYLINGIEKWVDRWKKNNWQTAENKEVKNKDLWESLLKQKKAIRVDWKHVAGHQGIAANERCDTIAVYFSQGKNIKLFKGKHSLYKVSLKVAPQKAPPGFVLPYYLSFIGGTVERHQSWEECSKRVQGISNAKYRKCRSSAEEEDILKTWGAN